METISENADGRIAVDTAIESANMILVTTSKEKFETKTAHGSYVTLASKESKMTVIIDLCSETSREDRGGPFHCHSDPASV